VESEIKEYIRVYCNGSSVVVPPEDADNYQDGDGYEYEKTKVFMTEDQYKNLPEFEGF